MHSTYDYNHTICLAKREHIAASACMTNAYWYDIQRPACYYVC